MGLQRMESVVNGCQDGNKGLLLKGKAKFSGEGRGIWAGKDRV